VRLSANLIVNFANINQFAFTNQWQIRAAEPNTLYFQIVDLDQNNPNGYGGGLDSYYGLYGTGAMGPGINTSTGLRYLVGIGSQNQPYSITVKFPSVDDSITILANAIQVNANDSSIWQVSISANQTPTSGNVIFSVTEGTATRSFSIMNALAVTYPSNSGSC
jgi:hypothetical protein